MDKRKSMIVGLALAAACGVAQAQIYQSKDADGNTVFSDTETKGATQVDLKTSNIADPVVEVPGEASDEPAATEEQAPPKESAWRAPDPDAGPNTVIMGDQTIRRRPVDTGDNPRHEVNPAEERGEQSSAVPRHERGDSR
jgi:hypothetical protein